MRGLQDNEKDKARNRERRAKRSGQENLNRTLPYMYKGSKLSDWTTEGAGCKMGGGISVVCRGRVQESIICSAISSPNRN